MFIIRKLEENKDADWLNIAMGKFELTKFHEIALDWHKEKPRVSYAADAPCMLRKGLPKAFSVCMKYVVRASRMGHNTQVVCSKIHLI